MPCHGGGSLVWALTVCLCLATTSGLSSDAVRQASTDGSLTFSDFIEHFGRQYRKGTTEFEMRKALFEERAEAVRSHNSRGQRWTAAINDLTDRTEDELALRRGRRGAAGLISGVQGQDAGSLLQQSAVGMAAAQEDADAEELALGSKSVDWRHLKSLKTVLDQGACGSCWALAVANVLGAHHEINIGKVRTFSAQELLACTDNPKECGGQGGCKGATMEIALDYANKKGLKRAEEMPYTEATGTCPAERRMEGGSSILQLSFLQRHHRGLGSGGGGMSFGMQSWHRLEVNKNAPLLRALLNGAVGVSVGASSWSSYSSGVFDSCGEDVVIDHAVTAIGFGQENGEKYWRIRNSWGDGWGEGGDIRLLRHAKSNDHCGWNNDPKVGTACKPYPERERVCGMCGVLFDNVDVTFAKGAEMKV